MTFLNLRKNQIILVKKQREFIRTRAPEQQSSCTKVKAESESIALLSVFKYASLYFVRAASIRQKHSRVIKTQAVRINTINIRAKTGCLKMSFPGSEM